MSNKLLAVYRMEVFEDGSVKNTLIEQYGVHEENGVIHLNEVSARSKQALNVIAEWVRLKNTRGISDVMSSKQLVANIIRGVSEEEGINYSTVSDKVSRQIFDNMQEFVDALDDFHNAKGQDGGKLEGRLKASASERPNMKDRQYISQVIQELREKYYE